MVRVVSMIPKRGVPPLSILAGASRPASLTKKRSLRYAMVLLPLLAPLVAGCPSGGSEQKPKQTSELLRKTALASIRSAADKQRQELVKQELARYAEKELTYSAAGLPPADRQLLAKLLEAAEVVEELNLLQVNARMLEYKEEAEKDGTEEDRRLFFRNHGPWCLDSRDVRCCALRSTPPKSVGMYAWPK